VADAAIFCGLAWYLSDQDPKLPVLVMAVLALSMLITYERARAESLGFQARGGLMERAERLVLLGIGLAFDVLVPMLWVMLALTALTAVQRFVKVWRQATPAGTRRARHVRRRGTDEPRAGSLAQWWAAHRPQTEKASQKDQAQKIAGPGAPRRR
jgi:CDP-diacylglycerol--glycerol-3-phosphate 3-phosphatidyltransferase